MLPDRVSNPGPLTYELGALPIALRGPPSYKTDPDFGDCFQRDIPLHFIAKEIQYFGCVLYAIKTSLPLQQAYFGQK